LLPAILVTPRYLPHALHAIRVTRMQGMELLHVDQADSGYIPIPIELGTQTRRMRHVQHCVSTTLRVGRLSGQMQVLVHHFLVPPPPTTTTISPSTHPTFFRKYSLTSISDSLRSAL
jgi:hypothetical protein